MYSSVVKFSSSFISSFITSLILIRIQSCNDECNLWWMYCNWYWWLMIVNHDWLTDWLTDSCKLWLDLTETDYKTNSLRSMKNFIVQPLKKLKGNDAEDVEWSSSPSSPATFGEICIPEVCYYGSWRALMLCRLLHSYLVALQLVGGCA